MDWPRRPEWCAIPGCTKRYWILCDTCNKMVCKQHKAYLWNECVICNKTREGKEFIANQETQI